MVKQETALRAIVNLDRKIDLVLDYVRTGENVVKPAGWPSFPLNSNDDFLEWELFLHNKDNYDIAVRLKRFYRSNFYLFRILGSLI